MDSPIVFLRGYLDTLKNQVINVRSAYDIWCQIQNRKTDRLEELNIAPAFFQVTLYSLLTTIIISLSRLYESPKRSDRNLHHFLDIVQSNLILFSPESYKSRLQLTDGHWLLKQREDFNISAVDSNRAELKSMDSILNNLFTWRDKMYAHMDEQYFHNPSQLKLDAPIKFAELKSLIDLAGKIVNKYSVGLDGSSFVFTTSNQHDLDKILDILHQNRQNKSSK